MKEKLELVIAAVLIGVAAVFIVFNPFQFIQTGMTFAPSVTDYGDPQSTYASYLGEVYTSNTFDEYVAIVSKYGTKQQMQLIQKKKKELDSLPAEFKQNTLELLKELTPAPEEVDSYNQTIAGIQAKLVVLARNQTLKGDIDFSKENEVWRIGQEVWKEV